MSDMNQIEDLLDQLQREETAKQAAQQAPPVAPAAVAPPPAKQASDPLGVLRGQLDALPDEIKQASSDLAMATYLADLKRAELFGAMEPKAAASQWTPEGEREFFNACFEDETEKIASADPRYLGIIQQEQIKAAFNSGFYAG